MTAGPSLTVTNLSAGYRGRMVLRELSIGPLASGRVVALVGPNAAGKSTLMLTMAGLLHGDGRVLLGDVELLTLPIAERARLAGFMPQSIPQGVALTVLEALIAAQKAAIPIKGLLNDDDSLARAAGVLDRLGIADIALEQLDRLSGGQRQLASLGQALIRDPKLLLLDEPTSALDLRHQTAVMKLIRSLAAEGRIVIVVLHDLSLAARWADDVIVMSEGRIAASGPPEQALTAATLSDVYGVQARVERCSRGMLQIMVDDTGQPGRAM